MSFDFDVKKANAEALEYVRKESLDIYNRLHSILEDVRFVGQVHDAYPELPILRKSLPPRLFRLCALLYPRITQTIPLTRIHPA